MTAIADLLNAAPAPRRIALVESESEILNVPHTDLRDLLGSVPGWTVRLFTERSVTHLPGQARDFDCIVVAEDATLHSDEVAEALALAPESHVVFLRQREATAYAAMGLGDHDLTPHHDLLQPTVEPSGGNRDQLALLSWPVQLGDDDLLSLGPDRIRLSVEPVDAAAWAPILTVKSGDGVAPILLMSAPGQDRRAVVSTITLPVTRPACSRLLVNAVWYAASGLPEIVVSRANDDTDLAILGRKLQLRGLSVVDSVTTASSPRFDEWPLRHAAIAISRSNRMNEASTSEAIREWLTLGGQAVSVEPDGSISTRYGLSDAQWLAGRWSAWFQRVPPGAWIGDRRSGRAGSLLRTLSVLRVLAHLHDESTKPLPARLGLPAPDDYQAAVEAMVADRILENGGIDNEVGVTVAGLECLRLAGCEDGRLTESLEGWLREVHDSCMLADRLAIARITSSAELLATSEDLLADPSEPLLFAQACLAAALSGVDLRQVSEGDGEELRSNPQLAAAYVATMCHPLLISADQWVEGRMVNMDNALYGLALHGQLLRGIPATSDNLPTRLVPEVCSEALALLRFLEMTDIAAHSIYQGGGAEAHTALAESLAANAGLRSRLVSTEAELYSTERAIDDLGPRLRLAQHVIGAEVLLLLAAVIVVALLSIDGWDVRLPALSVMTLASAGIVAALHATGLAPDWLVGMGRAVMRGPETLRHRLDNRED